MTTSYGHDQDAEPPTPDGEEPEEPGQPGQDEPGSHPDPEPGAAAEQAGRDG